MIGDDPETANSPGGLYVAVQDSAGKTATATNATVVMSAAWTRWTIPLSDFTGVNLAKVKKMMIGVGDTAKRAADGLGLIYVDDISIVKAAPAVK